MHFNDYVRPQTLAEAYELAQPLKNVVAGGMMWLHLSQGEYAACIDLCDLGLDQIEEDEEQFRIGAMVPLARLEDYEPFRKYFGTAFRDCLKHIVGIQFRNGATIGGSIAARLGFSDIITLLLPLDTLLEFYQQGKIPLADFLKSPAKRDILTHVLIPKQKRPVAFTSFRKTFTDLPILNICAVRKEDDYVFAVGSRPGIAMLCGSKDEPVFGSNPRGSKEYREHLYAVGKKRLIERLEEER